MRIIHVIDSGGLYGAEKVLLSLANAHRLQNIDVEIASLAELDFPTKPLELEAGKLGLKWRRFPIATGLDLRGIAKFSRYATATSTSLLHSHGYKANILLALLPKVIQSTPILTTLHGWTSTKRLERLNIYEGLEKAFLGRFDKVVAVSNSMVNEHSLDRRLGNRLTVIRNGIGCRPVKTSHSSHDLAQTRSEIRKFIGSRIPFVFAGRISPEKDLDSCIRAIQLTIHAGLDLCLVVFGDGPERQSAEKLIRKLNMTGRILFRGYCDHLDSILDQFRALIISSVTEGIPIVALEAMRAQIPVIATTVGGLPELVINEKTGLLVPCGDPKSLADGMVRLANDCRLAANMGIEGFQHLCSRFDIDEIASRYLSLYREIVQHPTCD